MTSKNDDDTDIVDDLIAMAEIIDMAQSRATVTMVSGYLFMDAADEIKRLRARLAAAQAQPHACSTGFFPCWCEEVRRG